MVLCLGETRGRFLLQLFFISFLYLHSIFVSSFCCCSSFHFQATSPCHRHSTLASQAREGFHQLWALPQLLSIAFGFFIYRNRYGFEWAFFTHRLFFTLRSFTKIFGSTYVYQGLPGGQQLFLEVCRTSYWSSEHRPGPSVCLVHANTQLSYSEEFIFKFYHIFSWITCGKKFSLYPPYWFRTHFACSKSYVKTVKKILWTRLNLYCL